VSGRSKAPGVTVAEHLVEIGIEGGKVVTISPEEKKNLSMVHILHVHVFMKDTLRSPVF
jgi:hypothetical protein